MHRYSFREAHLAIFDFCNDAISSTYCVAVKDRLYCDLGDSHRRRRTQTVMHSLAELLCRLLAPILPHTADEAYRSMHGDDVTIQMQGPLDLSYECDHEWSAVLNLREAALKRLEEAKAQGLDNPLDAGLVIPDPEGTFERFADELADACGDCLPSAAAVKFAEALAPLATFVGSESVRSTASLSLGQVVGAAVARLRKHPGEPGLLESAGALAAARERGGAGARRRHLALYLY